VRNDRVARHARSEFEGYVRSKTESSAPVIIPTTLANAHDRVVWLAIGAGLLAPWLWLAAMDRWLRRTA